MTASRFLDHLRDGDTIQLPAGDGLVESVHVIDQDSIDAINAALACGRPLLVRGEPGTGKSQLARAAAAALGRAFIPHAVDSRTETRDLLFTVDAVARLAEAQVMGARGITDEAKVKESIALGRFVHPGPVWWAFDWRSAKGQVEAIGATPRPQPPSWEPAHGVVVLIDEIDKADSAVPNGLLDALGHGRFDVDGRAAAVAIDPAQPSLVVMTTNEERALPDAFLRRCLVLHLGLPPGRDALMARLVARGRAHFTAQKCSDRLLTEAATLLADDREKLDGRELVRPGLAEYLDLVRAVTGQRRGDEAQLELLQRVAKFALRKHTGEPIA